MKHSCRILYVVLILCLIHGVCLVSCTAHYPLYPKQGPVDQQLQNRVAAKLHEALSDDVLVVLCFSGGGTRAASLSYGVLEALQAIELPARTAEPQGKTPLKQTLLDQVKVIMAVLRRPITASTARIFSKPSSKNFFSGTSRAVCYGWRQTRSTGRAFSAPDSVAATSRRNTTTR